MRRAVDRRSVERDRLPWRRQRSRRLRAACGRVGRRYGAVTLLASPLLTEQAARGPANCSENRSQWDGARNDAARDIASGRVAVSCSDVLPAQERAHSTLDSQDPTEPQQRGRDGDARGAGHHAEPTADDVERGVERDEGGDDASGEKGRGERGEPAGDDRTPLAEGAGQVADADGAVGGRSSPRGGGGEGRARRAARRGAIA